MPTLGQLLSSGSSTKATASTKKTTAQPGTLASLVGDNYFTRPTNVTPLPVEPVQQKPAPSIIQKVGGYLKDQATNVIQNPKATASKVYQTVASNAKRVGTNLKDLPKGVVTAVVAPFMTGEQLLKFNPKVADEDYARRIAGTFFDVGTAGVGGAELKAGTAALEGAAKIGVKDVLKTAAVRSAEGAAITGARSASQGDKAKQILENTAMGAAGGVVLGAAEKPAAAVVGKLLKRGSPKVDAELESKINSYLDQRSTKFRDQPKVNDYKTPVNDYQQGAAVEPKINDYTGDKYTGGVKVNNYQEPKINDYANPTDRTLRKNGRYNGSKAGQTMPDAKVEKSLMVLHNLSEGNYTKAKEIGGIANPSMAIVDSKKGTLDGFGDMTLVGDKNLPFSGKAKTMGADIYSPRFPSTETKVADFGAIRERLGKFEKDTHTYVHNLDQSNMRSSLENSPLSMADFLTGKGEKIPTGDQYEVRSGMRDIIEKKNLQPEYQKYLDELTSQSGTTEHIYTGHTPSGKSKTIPLTAENASKTMNKQELRGSEGTHYGLGSVRSNIAPEFKTISKIRENQGKIVTKDQFEKLKGAYENVHLEILQELSAHDSMGTSNPFMAMEHRSEALAEYIGGKTQYFNDRFKDVPADLMKKIENFKKSLQEMPTEYFETKFKRVVQPSEFKHAVVPDNVSPETLKKLQADGLNVVTYKAGDAADRSAKINGLNDVKFRLSDDFKRKTGQSITPEQESQLKAINKKLFGDENLNITEQILANKDALGSHQAGMIQIIEGQANPKDTLYHEAVHKYFDVFSSRAEQVGILKEAAQKYKLDDLHQVEEKLAEDFINYAKNHEGITGTIRTYFDSVLSRIKMFLGNESEVDKLYSDIFKGKAAENPMAPIHAATEPAVTPVAEQVAAAAPTAPVSQNPHDQLIGIYQQMENEIKSGVDESAVKAKYEPQIKQLEDQINTPEPAAAPQKPNVDQLEGQAQAEQQAALDSQHAAELKSVSEQGVTQTPAEAARAKLDQHVENQRQQYDAAQNTFDLANSRLDGQVENLQKLIADEERRKTGMDVTKIPGLDEYTQLLRDATNNQELTTNQLVDYLQTVPTPKEIKQLRPTELIPTPTGEKKVIQKNVIAPQPTPVGYGKEKQSRLFQRIKDDMVMFQGEDFTDSTYRVAHDEQQIKKAAEFVTKDFEGAVEALRTGKNMPAVLPNALFSATAHEALDRGEFGIAAEMANKMSQSATAKGQDISFLRNVGKDTPLGAMAEVSRLRAKAQGGVEKVAAKMKEETATETKKLVSLVKSETIKGSKQWADLIEGLRC